MSIRPERLRASGGFRVKNLCQAVGGDLGDKHLRNQGKRLVKGRVNPRNHQQEQEQPHKVHLSGENQRRSGENGGGYAQPHDDAGGVDKDAGGQFPVNHGGLVAVNPFVQFPEETVLLIGCPDFPHGFQRLLNAV